MTRREYLRLLVAKTNEGLLPAVGRRGDGETGCAYRTEGGLACAAGLLIPDADYRPEFEGQTVYGLQKIRPGLLGRMLPEGMDVADLWVVQSCHDSAVSAENGGGGALFRKYFFGSLLRLSCFADCLEEIPDVKEGAYS